MSSVIFYGAGAYAQRNNEKWLNSGWKPICYVDKDSTKHGKKIGDVAICSLKEAIENHPDFKLVITVDNNFTEIYNDIQKQGIPPERISFIVPREYRKGCRMIGKFFQYGAGSVIRPCCYDRGYIEYPEGGISEHFKSFKQENNRIIEGFRTDSRTSCDGCSEIKYDWWEIEPELNCLSLATGFKGDVCNARCSYCDADMYLKKANEKKISVLEAIKFFSERYDNLTVILNNGEFSVNKDKNEILRIIEEKNWYAMVLTNSIKFDQGIAHLMSKRKAEIQCSLDAGTQDTFKRIKGVDCFTQVCENLTKYSESGCVGLKYIVCLGINDNKEDIDGFVVFASKIRAKVFISSNIYEKHNMSESERDIYKYFYNKCKELGLSTEFPFDVFSDVDVVAMKELQG